MSRAGSQNLNGLSVFSAVPAEGSVAPGRSLDIAVTFRPDHPSVNYSDRLTVELANKVSTTPRTHKDVENKTLDWTLILIAG